MQVPRFIVRTRRWTGFLENGIKSVFPFSMVASRRPMFDCCSSEFVNRAIIRCLSSDYDRDIFTDIQLPPIHHGEFVKDRKSVFQAHLAPITHRKQVAMVLDKLKENKKIAQATHNVVAYRIECGLGSFASGCEDDGELHAGSWMLRLLNIVDARNVLVIVTRWYGGVHLGPDRFKHIYNCTRELLEAHGYVRDKVTEKTGTKSHSSGQESQTTSQSHRRGKKGR